MIFLENIFHFSHSNNELHAMKHPQHTSLMIIVIFYYGMLKILLISKQIYLKLFAKHLEDTLIEKNNSDRNTYRYFEGQI